MRFACSAVFITVHLVVMRMRNDASPVWGFVLDICGLEVDLDTGRVLIGHHIAAPESGRISNPERADRGTVAKKSATPSKAHSKSGTLVDYLVPTACEVPEPLIGHMGPSLFTPLGAKGIGGGHNMSFRFALTKRLPMRCVRRAASRTFVSRLPLHGCWAASMHLSHRRLRRWRGALPRFESRCRWWRTSDCP